MAKRRFQQPKPFKEGRYWWLRVWDMSPTGNRKRQRIKLARADMPANEVKKVAAEYLRPTNQGLALTGSAMAFGDFVEGIYKTTYLPLLSSSVQSVYSGVIGKHLLPKFGEMCLRDLTKLRLQEYFSSMAGKVPYPTISKIRDTLSSVLRGAVKADYLNKNPLEDVELPIDKRPRRTKPTITPQQFQTLVEFMAEPYATAVYTALWTGLRVSELLALKWRCIGKDSITIEERFCRGDWSVPKTSCSAATIAVRPEVIARLNRLKSLTVEVRAGRAIRKRPAVKSAKPDDLVFQSVYAGKEMSDENILKRHIKPLATKLGIPFVDWRCLRRSHATWLVQAGADPKSVQGQMRHSRISTTMEIYAQIVPQAQRVALQQLADFAVRSNSVQLEANFTE